jgi:hypothetical protein
LLASGAISTVGAVGEQSLHLRLVPGAGVGEHDLR